MGWILLAPPAVPGLPGAVLLLGFALAIWAAPAVAGPGWGVATCVLGWPVLAMVRAPTGGRAMVARPPQAAP